MSPVAERFIELSILQRHRRLTKFERRELGESIRYLEKLEWQKAKLKNLSLMASLTNDVDWNHEICAILEKLS